MDTGNSISPTRETEAQGGAGTWTQEGWSEGTLSCRRRQPRACLASTHAGRLLIEVPGRPVAVRARSQSWAHPQPPHTPVPSSPALRPARGWPFSGDVAEGPRRAPSLPTLLGSTLPGTGPGSSGHFHFKPEEALSSRPRREPERHQLTGDVCASPLRGLAGRDALGFHSRNLSLEPLSVATFPTRLGREGHAPAHFPVPVESSTLTAWFPHTGQLLSPLGRGQQGRVSILPEGPGSRVGQGWTQRPPLPPARPLFLAGLWLGLQGPGASHPAGLDYLKTTHPGALQPSGHLDAWGRSLMPPAPRELSPRRPPISQAPCSWGRLSSLLPSASSPRRRGVCLASGWGGGLAALGRKHISPTAPARVHRPSPGRTGHSPRRAREGSWSCYAPLEVVLKIKPRSSRDSRSWWGPERRAWAGRLPLSRLPKPSGFRVRGRNCNQPAQPGTPRRAGPPPGGAARGSGWGSVRAPALSNLSSGEWSRRPRTPHLPAHPAPPRAPAPPRGGASSAGARLSTRRPPPQIPKAARPPPAPGPNRAARSRGAPRTPAPAPLAPAPRPARGRGPRPADPSLPARRPGRRVSSGNFAATAGASGVIPRSGRDPERAGARGARERSPRRAERGVGPGARGARRRICPARAPGGAAGLCAGRRPGRGRGRSAG